MNWATHAHYRIAALVLGAVCVGGVTWYALAANGEAPQSYVVESRPLTRLVTFTGTVVPSERIDLAFERTGRVVSVSTDVGETVQRGDMLATLDAGDIRAQRLKAEANVAAAIARLDALKRGTRPEELAVLRAQREQARAAAEESHEALVSAIAAAYTTADTALYKTADQIFENPRTAPRLTYRSSNSSIDTLLESERIAVEELMTQWRNDTQMLLEAAGRSAQLSTTHPVDARSLFRTRLAAAATSANAAAPTLGETLVQTRERVAKMQNFFDTALMYINALFLQSSLSQTTIDGWKTSFTAARTSLVTERAALNTAYTAYINAQNAYTVAEAEVALSESGATPEAIREQEAAVAAAQADVLQLQSDEERYTLRSPLRGTITERSIQLGELAQAGVPAFSIDSDGAFEIDARVSELDVVALRSGQEATVTFDAYDTGAPLQAVISHVDPSETTNTTNLAGYGVTLTFTQEHERIRPGMTVNVLVPVVEREAALAVPSSYIRRDGAEAFVQVLENDRVGERAVTLGIVVPGGLIEIPSGLRAGDMLVPYEGK